MKTRQERVCEPALNRRGGLLPSRLVRGRRARLAGFRLVAASAPRVPPLRHARLDLLDLAHQLAAPRLHPLRLELDVLELLAEALDLGVDRCLLLEHLLCCSQARTFRGLAGSFFTPLVTAEHLVKFSLHVLEVTEGLHSPRLLFQLRKLGTHGIPDTPKLEFIAPLLCQDSLQLLLLLLHFHKKILGVILDHVVTTALQVKGPCFCVFKSTLPCV
uniref:Uncharacterized protein n=1 Tax=Tetraselmis sp. GSL018 TaxID=582737 RepID=A0A061QZ56_9CHLO